MEGEYTDLSGEELVSGEGSAETTDTETESPNVSLEQETEEEGSGFTPRTSIIGRKYFAKICPEVM